jgi:hypothetical protein
MNEARALESPVIGVLDVPVGGCCANFAPHLQDMNYGFMKEMQITYRHAALHLPSTYLPHP